MVLSIMYTNLCAKECLCQFVLLWANMMQNVTREICPLESCYCSSQVLQFYIAKIVAVLVIDLCAIIMTIIMITHIKSKYTAVGKISFDSFVGRKEMVQFFYSFFGCMLLEFLLVSNIIPFASPVYKAFT